METILTDAETDEILDKYLFAKSDKKRRNEISGMLQLAAKKGYALGEMNKHTWHIAKDKDSCKYCHDILEAARKEGYEKGLDDSFIALDKARTHIARNDVKKAVFERFCDEVARLRSIKRPSIHVEEDTKADGCANEASSIGLIKEQGAKAEREAFARKVMMGIQLSAKDTLWISDGETLVDAILGWADLPQEEYQKITEMSFTEIRKKLLGD